MSDKIYKADIRVPTSEQYAYLEIHVEDTEEGILEAYRGFTAKVKAGEGIPDKDFNGFIDRQLEGKNGSEDIPLYESMSAEQQKVVQIIKRSKKRLSK